jgi:cytochrome bd-type quinol oxidase subunit 2
MNDSFDIAITVAITVGACYLYTTNKDSVDQQAARAARWATSNAANGLAALTVELNSFIKEEAKAK